MSTNPRRRSMLAAGVMLAGVGLAAAMRPTRFMTDEVGTPDLESIFPRAFAGWRLDNSLPTILPAPDVQAKLDRIYNQVLSRTYVDAEGERVMLSVAYGGDQSDGTSAHRPEVCYPAQGFEITRNFTDTVQVAGRVLKVRRLMSRLVDRYEPITYWIVVGDEVVTTGIGQKLAQMRFGLRGVIADGLIVRVSTIDRDMAHGHAVQDHFLAAMGAAVDRRKAWRVLGQCSAATPDGDEAC